MNSALSSVVDANIPYTLTLEICFEMRVMHVRTVFACVCKLTCKWEWICILFVYFECVADKEFS